jgi:retron-type reverse transcriptase
MKLSSVWSRDNLVLAWRRVTTGTNLAYKRYFRSIYYAYEIALADNLRDLRARLAGGSFRPRQPTKVYLPKPSGLQRPVTLLYVEDQIVLQAIANVFASRTQHRRRRVEHKTVFSNIVQRPAGSIFFLQNWQHSYGLFQAKVERYFLAQYRWIAHFDLAAFYDTICHDMLLRTAFPRTADGARLRILQFLKMWSSENPSTNHGHGIPQGPNASDFLAECFLLPVDEALQRERIRYIRYVDDIRLFGRSQDEVRAAAIRMEILLRERGLIPQGQKHAVGYAKTLGEAMGSLPSINPQTDAVQGGAHLLAPSKAVAMFRSALDGRPLQIKDKTRVRYVLFRAPPSRPLLRCVLQLMPRHPEHIDAFVNYLSRYGGTRAIVSTCLEILKASPYEYVRGELWHVLATMMRPHEMRSVVDRAVGAARDKRACLGLRWGALHFLCAAERAGLGKYARWAMHQESALVQALLAPVLPDARFAVGDVAEKMLRRSEFEPGIALAEQLVRLRLAPTALGINPNGLPSQVRNTLRVLGIIGRRSPRVDPMGELLAGRYGTQHWDGWKGLFGANYAHALQLLAIADAAFDMGRSQWLSYQNSFNHSLFIAFQELLRVEGLPGAVKTKGRNGSDIKFGVLVGPNQPFSRAHPEIAGGLAAANTRRNNLPGSHPYELNTGKKARHLKKKEQGTIATVLARAYAEIIRIGSTILSDLGATGARK